MKILAIGLCLLLTACAGQPPKWMATYYNNQDPCQRTELLYTAQYPSYCGGASGKAQYVTRDYSTGRYLTSTTQK
jgi:hypothetical protein